MGDSPEYADVVVLGGCPIQAAGGGQMPTQISRWLGKIGHRVLYVQDVPLNGWNPRAPNLDVLSTDRISKRIGAILLAPKEQLGLLPDRWLLEIASTIQQWQQRRKLVCLLAIPSPGYTLLASILSGRLRAAVGLIICDDWQLLCPKLGGTWYSSELESILMERCHFVVATSKILRDRLRERNPNCLQIWVIENGFDHERFGTQLWPAAPPDFQQGEKTFIYWGHLIGDWIDWQMLLDVSNVRPDWKFLFIGPLESSWRSMHWITWRERVLGYARNTQRFVFLGIKNNSELARYGAHADFGIIPFKDIPVVHTINPIKAWEYLACGLKIIASGVQELKDWPRTSFLTENTAQSFISAVEQAKDEKVPPSFLEQATWKSRALEYSKLIQSVAYGGKVNGGSGS